MTLYTLQSKNIRKTWLLIVLFLTVVIGLGFLFSQIFNSPVVLYVAIAFSLVMNFFSYWYSDKIVLAVSGAKPASRQEHFDLYTLVENLSIAAGLPRPRVYIIPDGAPNAFATGRDKEHAAVAVTTGLLGLLDRTELEGVIAHELAHIGNRDILLQTIIVMLVGFVALISDFFLRFSFFAGSRRSGDRGDGRVQLLMFIAGIILAILAPIAALLIQLAISRKREFLADATGALLTRYPEGLASALTKINGYQTPLRRANHATAHLFIANPFGGRARSGLGSLFMTHPPVAERVAALKSLRY